MSEAQGLRQLLQNKPPWCKIVDSVIKLDLELLLATPRRPCGVGGLPILKELKLIRYDKTAFVFMAGDLSLTPSSHRLHSLRRTYVDYSTVALLDCVQE